VELFQHGGEVEVAGVGAKIGEKWYWPLRIKLFVLKKRSIIVYAVYKGLFFKVLLWQTF
jgi:hypothetical protein